MIAFSKEGEEEETSRPYGTVYIFIFTFVLRKDK